GNAPVVVARGGFSGLFPDSSNLAYQDVVQVSLPSVVVWCDVQLTKDGAGICLPDISLQQETDINSVYGTNNASYLINGVTKQGWLSLDFTLAQLNNVTLVQQNLSRAPYFDDALPILTVQEVVNIANAPGLWLNVQHDAFFSEHKLSMRSFIISVSRDVIINYISSPEIGFLHSVASRLTNSTKLVFRFLGPDDVEPTTNETYSSLLSNLTLIGTFASGILVPKTYIWPVNSSRYLLNYTSLVSDAHKAGLEVYASDFANDGDLPFNFYYDPVSEYLSYFDNGVFSVDGVISDFPITPSAAIGCFSHLGRNAAIEVNILVISNEGASGIYPGCTDKAYEQAAADGADVLDCPVQISSDGIPFCLGSINLRDRTNAAQSAFLSQATDNPDLNIQSGIFTYNLTWSQIQTLSPAMYSPYAVGSSLYRNPIAANEGKFLQLSEFLAFASNNATSVSEILIGVENDAYLAQNQGLDLSGAVLDVLSQFQPKKKILIRSSDSAVLWRFKNNSSSSGYELVYLVEENIGGILNSTVSEIAKFASSVVISKESVFPLDRQFTTGQTTVVGFLQGYNLSVYVQDFQNEFFSQPWDFYSDATVEINSYVSGVGINGVVTDYPGTANRYRRRRCLGYKNTPNYMLPVQPGSLITLLVKNQLPPAPAPSPVLTEGDVIEAPLPPVVPRVENVKNETSAPA
ncbi:glycerophosphodiesterase-like protein, partial [Genlisea aurea]